MSDRKKVTIRTLFDKAAKGELISWLTCYDYPTAYFQEQAEIDMMLVGDSLGMTMLGYDGTLPVTIAYLQASHKGNQLSVEWSTATETSNIGFNIYAVVLGEWIKLNDAPIPGSLDSLEPQHYEEMLANPFGNSLTEIGIAGVDVDGIEDRHGPYVVGKARGKRPHAEKINWKQVRSEMKAGLNARKARKAATAEKGKYGHCQNNNY